MRKLIALALLASVWAGPVLAADATLNNFGVAAAASGADLIPTSQAGTPTTSLKQTLTAVATWLWSTVSGDATASSGGAFTLASTAVTPASYTNTNLTVDAKGRITAASNGTAGTVTSVATTGPITGGTITATGTIACATCVTSAAALTNNAPVIGGGLQASSTVAAMTNGQLLVGATGAAPVPQTMSGDATLAASGAITISASAITVSKMANMAAGTVLGNTTGSAAPPTATVAPVLGLNGGTGGSITLEGATSGAATIAVAAAAGTPTNLVLPTTTGTNGQFLQTNGGTPQQLSWQSASGSGTVASGSVGNAGYYSAATTISPVVATAHGLFVGEGGSIPVFTAAGASANLLLGQGAADPTWNAMSGDATISSSGALTIAANAVTYAKFQQVAASSLVGNPTGSLANAQAITLGTPNLVFSGTTIDTTTPINAQTGTSYTVLTGDNTKLVTFSNAGAIAVTLPQAGSAGFLSGWSNCYASIGAGASTITTTTSTINGSGQTAVLQNQGACFGSDGTNWDGMIGLPGNGTSGQLLIAQANNSAAYKTASGDMTVSASGAFTASAFIKAMSAATVMSNFGGL